MTCSKFSKGAAFSFSQIDQARGCQSLYCSNRVFQSVPIHKIAFERGTPNVQIQRFSSTLSNRVERLHAQRLGTCDRRLTSKPTQAPHKRHSSSHLDGFPKMGYLIRNGGFDNFGNKSWFCEFVDILPSDNIHSKDTIHTRPHQKSCRT